MMHLSEEILFTATALLCAGVASVHDVRERRIPNWITGPSVLIALVAHLVSGGASAMLDSVLAGLLAGSVMLLFFLAGGMGAGDVKLMVAVGCMVGLAPLSTVLLATAFCGAVFALGVALHHDRLRQTVANAWMLIGHHREHGLTPHRELSLESAAVHRMPFALPIAAGCLIVLGGQLWGS